MRNKRIIKYLIVFIGVLIAYTIWNSQKSTQPLKRTDIRIYDKVHSAKPKKLKASTKQVTYLSTDHPAPSKVANFENKISQDELHRARSKAKSYLSSMYSAQKGYFAEFNRFTTDLKSIGWTPQLPDLHFKAGFLKPIDTLTYNDFSNIKEDPRRMDTDIFIGEYTDIISSHNGYISSAPADQNRDSYSYAANVEDIRLGDFEKYCRQGCSADKDSFEMILVSPIGDSKLFDVWLIDNSKEIVLVKDGLKTAE